MSNKFYQVLLILILINTSGNYVNLPMQHGKQYSIVHPVTTKMKASDTGFTLPFMQLQSPAGELESTYKITIAQEGDVAYPYVSQSKWDESAYVRARNPSVDELTALKNALKQSNPAYLTQLNQHSNGITFYFLKDRLHSKAIADWSHVQKGAPAIFIEPCEDEQISTQMLERVLIHELAHNSTYRMGYNPFASERWKMAKVLGWRHFCNPYTNEYGWSIRSDDKDERYFKFSNKFSFWVRCNKDGQPLNINGERVKRQIDAEVRTPEQMAHTALVKPATTYFINPMEMFAEALTLFRLDYQSRAQLLEKSPTLYCYAKKFDQQEIDSTYGNNSYLRSVNGRLVAQTPEAYKIVQNLEQHSSLENNQYNDKVATKF